MQRDADDVKTLSSELSVHDSLVSEMVTFLDPQIKLSKSKRKDVERTIKSFPHRIVRRDTSTYFLQTAYAVAYYEFVKHDYKKGLGIVREFDKNAMPLEFLEAFWLYPSVGYNASGALARKGNIKVPREKNSWATPIKSSSPDTIFSGTRTEVQFLRRFFDNIPMTCQTETYRKALTLYHRLGGKLKWLNNPYSIYDKGFFQKCRESSRDDVFEIIYSLWNVNTDDFEFDTKSQQLIFKHFVKPIPKEEFSISDFMRNLTIEGKIEKIDSLIAIGNDASETIVALLDQSFCQNKFKTTIDYCNQYGQFVSDAEAISLHNIWGLACSNIGRYDDALFHLDQAILFADNPADLSTVRLNKAYVLGEIRRTDEAIAIIDSERKNQKTPFRKFVWNDYLGYVYSFIDPKAALYYYDEAEKHLDSSALYDDRKVRHFCRKARLLVGNQFAYRTALDRVFDYINRKYADKAAKGMAYTEEGRYFSTIFDYEAADKSFKKAYECFEWLDTEDGRMYELNRSYASNLCALGSVDEAITLLSQQLALQDSLLGASSYESFKTLQILIPAYCKSSAAEVKHIKTLADRYSKLSKDFKLYIDEYNDVALKCDYFRYIGQPRAAINLIKSADKSNMSAQQCIALAAAIEQTSRLTNDSAYYSAESHLIIEPLKHDVVATLLTLNENERHSIQSELQRIIDGLIEGGNIEDASSLLLFKKGLLFSTKHVVEKRLSGNRKTKKDFNRLKALRVSLNDAIAFADSMHIPVIHSDIIRLERRLNSKISSDKRLFASIDRTLRQVQSQLGEHDIAVDFVRHDKEGKSHLGAFVITKHGSPSFVQIDEEDDVLTHPEMIWDNIATNFNNAGEIYFCPDGRISSIGIEFLPDSNGIPVNQKYKLHRVFHLSDISKKGRINKEIVLIGVSDHNSPVGEGESIDRGTFTDLPNVGYELKLIGKCMSDYSPRIIFNDEADERTIKSLNGTFPSVLHISTHGFYKSQEQLLSAVESKTHPDYNIAHRTLAADKTALSGLVLRGGNLSWRTHKILDTEDDILTSDEVENLSFPNLQLTVLSACESGLGDVDDDGVWGLPRAFRIAGSKSVLCTLHNIPDYETAFFMEQFYNECAKSGEIYESFQNAQRILRDEYKDDQRIWTAFILIE